MSLHAMSTLRDRKSARVGVFTLVLNAMLALWLAVSNQVALAAPVPPPANANPKSVITPEDTLVAIDTDVDFDNTRYQIVIVTPGPVHGTAIESATASADGDFVINYTPGANQTNQVSFAYQICTKVPPADPPILCGQSATVTVSITAVNDGPQAGPDTRSTTYGQSILIDVLANDNGGANEGDAVSLVAGSVTAPTDAPANMLGNDGTAVIEGNQIRYTAPTNAAAGIICPAASQAVTFNYQAQDSSGQLASGTVTVNIICPAPIVKLGVPYGESNQTFKVDVILESTVADVSALDATFAYNSCLTEPDLPTDNKLADDVSTTLSAGSFFFQAQDMVAPTPGPGTIRIIAASTTSPAAILAGPSGSTNRTIATIQFRLKPAAMPPAAPCTPNTNIDITPVSFTDVNGFGLSGGSATDDIPAALDPAKLNSAPTNITLSNNKAPENTVAFIGKFTTTDADNGDTHKYTVVLLTIVTPPDVAPTFQPNTAPYYDELYILNPGVRSGIYKIRVTATDSFGGTFTKDFDIELTDLNKAPKANDDGNPLSNPPGAPITAAGPTVISVLANDTDGNDFPLESGCPGCSVVSATNGSKGIVVNQGTNVRYIPTDPKFNSTDSLGGPFVDTFTYVMTDNDAPNALTSQAKVTVTVAAESYPANHLTHANQVVKLGDCNGSGTVEAGDLTSTGLEIFDGDGSLWYDIYKGSRTTFSPRGCNSNQDGVLDSGDISCTARKIFTPSFVCSSSLLAASANTANLTVGTVSATPGATVQVPVQLSTAGHSVAAAAFAVDFNGDELSFDATDTNNDGMPDAVSLQVPNGLLATATYNADESRIEIVVSGLIPPFPLLSDGAVATVNLAVKEGVNVTESKVMLVNSSLGNDEGQSVPLEVTDGAIQIGGQPANRVLLPLIRMQ